jgi:hypothetical protein
MHFLLAFLCYPFLSLPIHAATGYTEPVPLNDPARRYSLEWTKELDWDHVLTLILKLKILTLFLSCCRTGAEIWNNKNYSN